MNIELGNVVMTATLPGLYEVVSISPDGESYGIIDASLTEYDVVLGDITDVFKSIFT